MRIGVGILIAAAISVACLASSRQWALAHEAGVDAQRHGRTLERRTLPGDDAREGAGVRAAAPMIVAEAARSGKAIYEKSCVLCHYTGAEGAPRVGDVEAWRPRIAKGMDVLYGHAINGFKGMPIKGLCYDCSEHEVKAAVEYIVENSR